jgi:gliding motility-associated-like protein
VNGVPNGVAGPSFSGQNFANGDIIQCIVTIDPNFSCALTNTATSMPVMLSVINQPNPTISITAMPGQVCKGGVMDFSATESNGGTDPSYQWMVNGQPVGGNSAAFGSGQLNNGDVVVCELLPGAGACLSSAVQSNTVVTTVQPLPVVAVSPADTIVLMGGRVMLRGELSGDVVSYQWTPAGLLVDPQSATPETVALQDSVGFVLTAETAAGCTSSASAKVLVYRALAMPNAFTPNGDGVNDLFRIPAGATMTLTEFSVYDRWGTRVFDTRDVSQGWDGWFGWRPAPAGVYVYVVVGYDLRGPVSAKGTVVLVR